MTILMGLLMAIKAVFNLKKDGILNDESNNLIAN